MKIEVEITKGRFLAIFGAVLFMIMLIGVTAYTSSGTGGSPSNAGHSVDEIDWSKAIVSNLILNGNLNVSGAVNATSLYSRGNINGTSLSISTICIAGNCRTSWPTATGTSVVCAFDGTWGFNDEGNGNDFAITCKNGVVTGICTPANLCAGRGFHSKVYCCG